MGLKLHFKRGVKENMMQSILLRRSLTTLRQTYFGRVPTRTCSTSSERATTQTFANLIRNCKLTQMGDPVGKTVVGKIYHVVDDDLYIDFGNKFPCVCQRPRENKYKYVRGAEVKLLIKDLEMSQRFLGYDKEMTLLEADCVLLGLNN